LARAPGYGILGGQCPPNTLIRNYSPQTAVGIANRAMPVIAEIQEKYAKGNVLIVSHKATIRVILCSLLGIDLGRYRDRIDAPAGSVSLVKFDLHGPLLQALGDRSYMDVELRSRRGT
jgi:broad specificity phosphatase PhoE